VVTTPMNDEPKQITATEALRRLAEQEFTREQRIALAKWYAAHGDKGAQEALKQLGETTVQDPDAAQD
jgi:hypothetical protein